MSMPAGFEDSESEEDEDKIAQMYRCMPEEEMKRSTNGMEATGQGDGKDLPSWPPQKSPAKPGTPQQSPATSPTKPKPAEPEAKPVVKPAQKPEPKPEPKVEPKPTPRPAQPPLRTLIQRGPPPPEVNGEAEESSEEEEEEEEEESSSGGSREPTPPKQVNRSPPKPQVQSPRQVQSPTQPQPPPQPKQPPPKPQTPPKQQTPPKPQPPPKPRLQDVEEMRMAIMHGNLPLVRDCLKKGIKINEPMKDEWTPLMYACGRGQHEIARLLIQEGADPNVHKDSFTPLMAACVAGVSKESDVVEVVEVILGAGANVNATEKHKMTGLMFACREGKLEVTRKLLAAGAAFEKQDNHGWTALMWAANKGHGHLVRALLKAGSDPTVTCQNAQTAANHAYFAGHEAISEILNSVIQNEWKVGQDPSVLNGLGAPTKRDDSSTTSLSSELDTVLTGLGLTEYLHLFKRHKVDFLIFQTMDEKDLDRVGITELGARRKILDCIKRFNLQHWEKSSLPAIDNKGLLTCPDLVATTANVTKHLKYIVQQYGYMRTAVENNPKILELGKETCNVQQLCDQLKMSVEACQALNEENVYFLKQMNKISGNPEYVSADLVSSSPKRSQRKRFFILAVLGLAAGSGVYIFIKKPEPIWEPVSAFLAKVGK